MSLGARAFSVLLSALILTSCTQPEDAVLDAERNEEAAAESANAIRTVTHADVSLSVRVPAGWSGTRDSRWQGGEGGGANLGHLLVAAPRVGEFVEGSTSGWHAPGVMVGVSETLLESVGLRTEDPMSFSVEFARLVGEVDYGQDDASCDYKGVSSVGTDDFDIGLHRLWTGCANGRLTVADFWTAAKDSQQLVYAVAVVPGKADVKAAERVLASVRYRDAAVVDLS